MARAMWQGAIQFGLVTIPVKLYLATESKGISFNMLHKKDLSRIQMKIYCPVDDEVISRGDTVKGFEYAPGQYVVITDEDLEAVPLKTVRTIEIEQFTQRDVDEARRRPGSSSRPTTSSPTRSGARRSTCSSRSSRRRASRRSARS